VSNIEPLKLSLHAISAATGESLPVLHDAINAGDLKTFLVGRRRFAKPEAVRAWVDFLEAESNAGRPVCYRARSNERVA
jgi:hypothetical protein